MIKKKKIAICLFGLTGSNKKYGEGKKLDFLISHKNYIKNIVQDNECDFFIHSWSHDQKKKIINTYKPKKFIIEKQFPFSSNLSNYSLKHIRHIKSDATKLRYKQIEKIAFASKSFLYSISKSAQLFLNYSKQKNKRYDHVLFLRFDLIFKNKLKFDKLRNKNLIYTPRRKIVDKKYAIHCLFFIMPQKFVFNFSEIYIYSNLLNPRSVIAFKEYFKLKKIPHNEIYFGPHDYSLLRLYDKDKKISLFEKFIKKFKF